MPIYCFKCRYCGATKEQTSRTNPMCETRDAIHDVTYMVRDYKAEGAVTHIPLHMSSRNTSNKSDFLPTAKDFESPSDPTGEKGMQTWKDTHKVKGSTWV